MFSYPAAQLLKSCEKKAAIYFTLQSSERVRGHRLQCRCVPYIHGGILISLSYFVMCLNGLCVRVDHFSCRRAGMLMFQPMACRSKPQVKRLHDWFSSFHAVQHTIRLWPILLLRGSLASRTPLMSNSRTCRLSCGRAMILWLADTLILFTAESVRMVAIGDLIFFRSQTLTVRSSLPDTTLSPTVNTADVTVSVCPWKTLTE